MKRFNNYKFWPLGRDFIELIERGKPKKKLIKLPPKVLKGITFFNLINLGLHIGDIKKKFNKKTEYFLFALRKNLHILDMEILLSQLLRLKISFLSCLHYPFNRVLLASEEPATDFFLYKFSIKKRHFSFVGNHWIPGF
jgi:ribosomal protein S2